MDIRPAAKGIIRCADNSIVLVAGKRGRFNLPGGGIEAHESELDAFYRESCEELDLEPHDLGAVQESFCLQDEVTTDAGIRKIARWTVFKATLLIPTTALHIPHSSEVTAIETCMPAALQNHPNISRLARTAVGIAHA